MSVNSDRIKDTVDAVSYIQSYVSLKKKGTVHVGLCPFHNEKSGSFTVYSDGYKCFGCGASGSVIDFAMKYHHLDFGDALEELARFAGITLEPLSPEAKQKQDKTARLYAAMEAATEMYAQVLYAPFGMFALAYLKKRGLTDETIKEARIGYSEQGLLPKDFTDKELIDAGLLCESDKGGPPYPRFRNRIMIPIRDHKGRVVAFSGRDMGDKGPKYLHNATNDIFRKSEIVHRIPVNLSKTGIEAFKTIIAVEGTIDPVSALNRGFYNVVSLLGKSLSDAQIDTLCKWGMERLVFCLDRDEAGRAAVRTLTEKHVSTLASKGIELRAMFAPHGKDPDDTFREHPELWADAVDAARPVVEVLIDMEISALPANASAVDKTKMALALVPLLRSGNPMIETENIQILATRLNVGQEEMERWIRPQVELKAPAKTAAMTTSAVNASSVPTMEEWVLHGLLVNEDEDWLTRANTRLMIASVENLPYALASLSIQDFTEPAMRRLIDLILKGQDPAILYTEGKMELALRVPYERIFRLDLIGKEYGLNFDFNVFVDAVYELRIKRLMTDRDSSKARECAMAIACLRMAQEDLIEA